MLALGFLHTSPVHVATFDRLLHERGAGPAVHVVDESLLTDARREGVTPAMLSRLDSVLTQLSARGATRIVCSCSTLSAAAEQRGAVLGFDVIRVDRPMAARAVALGRRILVVAALDSTIGPTTQLLADEAARVGVELHLHSLVVAGAWDAFERGDHRGYAALVAAAVRVATDGERFDAVVLAQASMAEAADELADLGVPVLASPALAVDAALR